MNDKYAYRAFEKANTINKILKAIVKGEPYKGSSAFDGAYSDEGGFEFFYDNSRHRTGGYLGPLVKLHVKVGYINWTGDASKISTKRINGDSYYYRKLIVIIIGVLVFLYALKEYIFSGNQVGFVLQLIPLLCLLYYFVMELNAQSKIKRIRNSLLKILSQNGIEIEDFID